jgi:hypothetical protein
MNPQEAMQVIPSVVSAVVGELERVGEQHSCIFAGALLAKVLNRLNMGEAHPLTVRAFIMNPQLLEWVKANGFAFNSENEKKWTALGGHGITLGYGPEGSLPADRWMGHLAVILPNLFGDRHAMFDLTAPQATKPDWGINLAPVIVRVPESFVRGETEFKAPANGSMVIYKAFPDDHSYTESKLWKNQAQYDSLAERLILQMVS